MFSGLAAVARGLAALARRPRLWIWVAAPAAIAVALLVGITWLGLSIIDTPVDRLVAPLPDLVAGLVAGVLDLLLIAVVAVAGYVVFFSLASLIAAPFNEVISESLEAELTGAESPRFAPLVFARDLVVGVVHGTRRAGVYVGGVLVVVALGLLIPVAGPLVAVAVSAYLTARAAAWDAMDAVFARKGASYGDKRDVLRRHPGRWLGLGAAIALLMLVPGLNLVALSGGAAGATLLCHDRGEL